MTPSRRNPGWGALYLLLVALFLAALETGVRSHEDEIASLQDGSLIKLQMFLLRQPTDILFIGTSRSQDGIDPSLIAGQMGQASGHPLRGFNAAAAGGSLDRMYYLADKALDKPGLRLLGLEVSTAQLSDTPWSPDFNAPETTDDFEGRLQHWVSRHVYTVRYRKTFRLENIVKYPFLLFPDADDGTRWFGQVGTRLLKMDTPTSELTPPPWNMDRLKLQETTPASQTTDANSAKINSIFLGISEKARQRGVTLFLYAPPVSGSAAQSECSDKNFNAFRRISRQTGAPLFFYDCTDAPVGYFSDETHLTSLGKQFWSTRLAADMAASLDWPR